MRRLFILFLLVLAPSASAADFTVDTTDDTPDNTTADSVCRDANGHCSLRAAFVQANALAGPDTITVPARTYKLTSAIALPVSSNVTVKGDGARSTIIDGQGAEEVIEVSSGSLTISGFTLTGGQAGIYQVAGDIIGTGLAIQGNGGTQVAGAFGIGIRMDAGALTLRNSAIVRNVVNTVNSSNGVGLYVDADASAQLYRVTVAENVLNVGGSGNTADGAGIGTFGSLGLHHVTLANNSINNTSSSATGGRNLTSTNQPVVFEDSINTGGDCLGTPPEPLGHNLDSDGSCMLGDKTDPPALALLGDHGGPVDTMPPLQASPAVDAASACGPDALDVRGSSLPLGAACDLGAAELGATRSVTLQAAPGTVAAGGATTIVAAAHNDGPDPAAGTNLSFALPAGASVQLLTSAAGTCTGTTCDLGTLASGASATVTLSLRLDTAGSAVTTATLTGTTPDASTGDDAASVTTTVTGPGGQTKSPDTVAPKLTKVRLKGKRLRFRLSEAATVRVKIKRRHHKVKTIRRRKAKGAGSIKLKLGKGHVKLAIRATDAAGNRSLTVRRHR